MTDSVLAVLFRKLRQSATLCLIARCTPVIDLHSQMQLTTLSYAVTHLDGEQCHGTSGISFCSMMARLRGLRSLPCSSGVASKFICTGFLHKHTKRVMLMFAIISLTRTYLQSLLSWKSRDCNPPTSTAPSGARQKAGRRHSCSIFGSRVSAVMATACGGFYLLGTLRIVVVVVAEGRLAHVPYNLRSQARRGSVGEQNDSRRRSLRPCSFTSA